MLCLFSALSHGVGTLQISIIIIIIIFIIFFDFLSLVIGLVSSHCCVRNEAGKWMVSVLFPMCLWVGGCV